MRILWHSASPWTGSGYGTQTAIWCRYLREQGHDVAISAYHGSPGKLRKWDGFTVYPPPEYTRATALLPGHARLHKADLIISLCDLWTSDPAMFDGIPAVCWIPVDCKPLGLGDQGFFTRARQAGVPIMPVAMSLAGQQVLQDFLGEPVHYIPHGFDTEFWKPDPHRAELRAAYDVGPDTFVIGANFNNIDPFRKATPSLMLAFSRFHAKHPDSMLFCHTCAVVDKSLDLRMVTQSLGIREAVRFADQYKYLSGGFTDEDIRRWYNLLDVLSNATMGEGFGIPAIEAQSCGVPVILSDNSTGPELKGPGWTVPCEPFWNPTHSSWWGQPRVDALVKAFEQALASRKAPMKREACRRNAERYDIRVVGPMWTELLEEVADGIRPADSRPGAAAA